MKSDIQDTALVCSFCGSQSIAVKDRRGWCECNDCGERDHAMQYGDWLTGQEDAHMIPEGYSEP